MSVPYSEQLQAMTYPWYSPVEWAVPWYYPEAWQVMTNNAWLDPEQLQAVTFLKYAAEAWQRMEEVTLPLKFPMDPSDWRQAILKAELPLHGQRWSVSVLSRIAHIYRYPESWNSSEQLPQVAIIRDQLMLGFIVENQLIPYTTEQVIKWLDWYGTRVKKDDDVEIWCYPHFEPVYYFHVDIMIKGTSTLVDFLLQDSHLFSAKVFEDNTMKDILFTFVSKNKEDIAKRKHKRRGRVGRPRAQMARSSNEFEPAASTQEEAGEEDSGDEDSEDEVAKIAEGLRKHLSAIVSGSGSDCRTHAVQRTA